MAKLVWDKTGERRYQTGVSKGVYFPQNADGTYGAGEAWNGLSAVNESPSGAESNPIYADNIKYLDMRSNEDFGCTIEAYTYPDGFNASDGKAQIAPGVRVSQQNRSPFGFSYQTIIGNDTEYNDHGYTIHLVYGATVSPSERNRQTVNDSPEATAMSWEATTVPVAVPDHKPTAHLEIDSIDFVTEEQKAKLAAFEAILYGSTTEDARLPLPEEIITLFAVTTTEPTEPSEP